MLNQSKIRTMVIDDSLVFRKFLIENLPKLQPQIEIVGYAINAYDAMRKVPELKPDVITLDIEMPRMSGIDFLKELLPKHPIPVILVSSLNVSVFDALSYGAVDFVRKPDMSAENSTNLFLKNLSSKVSIASHAKVRLPAALRQRPQPGQTSNRSSLGQGQNQRKQPQPVSNLTANRPNQTVSNAGIPSKGTVPSTNKAGASALYNSIIKLTSTASLRLNSTIIAIGASTGGTEATLDVMRQLPADIPGIVITQHMPKGFTQMYAERLNRLCQMQVKEAEDGDVIKRGLALLAPGGDLQMKVVKDGGIYKVRCVPGEKVNGHRPSVDVLFDSTAETVGKNAVGIILTGMGQDGAEGLLRMRKAGAYTIGQDKDSCVVYGMPMVAYKLGAVCSQASCLAIPGVLMKYLNGF
ncbi:MAG: chemotaxis response regulator protein-glutamate methylesterase [Firmicutes bacterium]|jgi:two-component system chemotaxis response regulator CheB|nr:chemotaxis response regulator protein-glutamate methylesterase [Bacillota bacterium]NBI63782.1 chemotaxis response regulator protein-glutamate methylesterase [Clostridiales bacterium]